MRSAGDTQATGIRSGSGSSGPLDEIRKLTERNRSAPDAEVETRLVQLRHDAFASIEPVPPLHPPPCPPTNDGVATLVELSPGELDITTLRESIALQGCALVRGLLDPDRAAALRSGIDRMFDVFDRAGRTAEDLRWYQPFVPKSGEYRIGGRKWMREGGGLWAADSPRLLFELCELLEDSGIGDLATEHLGERPALSANKCNLRRVPVTRSGSWHQDGAFLGRDSRSLNLWLALSPCGEDAPGLDVVPRRLDHVVQSGSEGTYFDWSVAPDVVEEVAATAPVLRPQFEAGDALLFDHFFLHRTAVEQSMSRDRYAVEAWMFAPSVYPSGQVPLVF